MEPKGYHPVKCHQNQVHKWLSFLTIITIFCSFLSVAHSQETSGFKPVNGDKINTGSTEEGVNKPTEFLTYNNNQNQRNLLQQQNNNNNNSQPFLDYYTRGLPNYIGGPPGQIPNNQNNIGQIQTNSIQGFYPPNFNPFGQAPQQGIPFPNGIPFPGPFPPFQGFGGYPPGSGIGPGGEFGKPSQQFPGQSYPPQFQFNRPPNIPNPTGGPGYFPQGPGGSFPGQGGYPQYPVSNGAGGGGIGNLYLGLPRQIKVPGRIEINLNGNIAEIICEFPRFLILIQKVYWHHRYEDPYGTYYDSNNGFGPRVTVVSVDKWKSVLQIREYNEDDFGTYRCFTAAVLPDEASASSTPAPGYGNYGGNINQGLLRSPSTTTENTVSLDYLRKIQLPKKSSKRNGKDMKFPLNNRVTRKIRFARSLPFTTPNSLQDYVTKSSINAKRQADETDSKIKRNKITNKSSKENDLDGDLMKQASNEIYDPYYYQNYPNHYNEHDPTSRSFYSDNNINQYPNNGLYGSSTLPPTTNFPGHSQLHNSRYNPFAGFGGGIEGPYGIGGPNQNPQVQPSQSSNNGYGPYASFYKPSYGLFTIYQEIKFAPMRRSVASASNTSPATAV